MAGRLNVGLPQIMPTFFREIRLIRKESIWKWKNMRTGIARTHALDTSPIYAFGVAYLEIIAQTYDQGVAFELADGRRLIV